MAPRAMSTPQRKQANASEPASPPETAPLPDVTLLSRNQAKRRQRIVDEAYDMILESGGENVQIRDVADRAGVALGTAYRYFRSKDRLFAEAYDKWHQIKAAELAEFARRGKTNTERLRLVAAKLLDQHAREPEFAGLVRRSLSSANDPAVIEILHRCENRANDVFRLALHDIEPRDADAIALLIASWVHNAIDRLTRGVVTIDEIGRLVAKAVKMVLEFRDPTLDAGGPARARRPKARSVRS